MAVLTELVDVVARFDPGLVKMAAHVSGRRIEPHEDYRRRGLRDTDTEERRLR